MAASAPLGLDVGGEIGAPRSGRRRRQRNAGRFGRSRPRNRLAARHRGRCGRSLRLRRALPGGRRRRPLEARRALPRDRRPRRELYDQRRSACGGVRYGQLHFRHFPQRRNVNKERQRERYPDRREGDAVAAAGAQSRALMVAAIGVSFGQHSILREEDVPRGRSRSAHTRRGIICSSPQGSVAARQPSGHAGRGTMR